MGVLSVAYYPADPGDFVRRLRAEKSDTHTHVSEKFGELESKLREAVEERLFLRVHDSSDELLRAHKEWFEAVGKVLQTSAGPVDSCRVSYDDSAATPTTTPEELTKAIAQALSTFDRPPLPGTSIEVLSPIPAVLWFDLGTVREGTFVPYLRESWQTRGVRDERKATSRIERVGQEQRRGEQTPFNDLFETLRSGTSSDHERAAYELAFGSPRVDYSLVPHLESALDHDSPQVLALLLTTLCRAVFEHPSVTLQRVDRVRELTSHEDQRVAWAADALMLQTQRGARASPISKPTEDIDVPKFTTEETAARLKLSERTVRQHAKNKKFGTSVAEIGGSYVFTERQIRHYEQHRKPAGRPANPKKTDSSY